MSKTMKKLVVILSVLVLSISAFIARDLTKNNEGPIKEKLHVTVTTTFLGDLVTQIAGDKVHVTTLMGPGVDPHQFTASSSDLNKLLEADVIFFGGLHLEAKLAEILEKIDESDIVTVDTSRHVPRNLLHTVSDSENVEQMYDPHIWFNIDLWSMVADEVTDVLAEQAPEFANDFRANRKSYGKELDELAAYVKARINELPKDKRYLVTAHDAFNYFGDYTGMHVQGIQGFNTVVEAGTSDVSETADFIVEHEIKAIFVESTISPKLVQALQESVHAKGFDVKIGGELYSDSAGNGGTFEGTYVGMYYHNIDTIIDSLK